MKPVIRINRDTLITALLVVAGIVLALALFGAGVLWRSKSVQTKFRSWKTTQLDMVQTPCLKRAVGFLPESRANVPQSG
jgi:hypothetical protein